MKSAQTSFVTLANGDHIWTRRVGYGPRKLMLVHDSTTMPWNYLTAFTEFARENDVEIIFVELLGSYLSDQPTDITKFRDQERLAEIQHVVAAYDLERFTIHGIGEASSITRQYVSDHPHIRRLLTNPDDLALARASELLGNYDNVEYQGLIRSRMRQTQLVR
ncbi:alpha/beta fold hydrolase [Limosilactobacillus caecicola]|uniref:alpha/beta fold hydrolase n=1 Tax=Limosilactobacillus caecicola TaxID=2941332 RepID=UPI00203CD740|nr:hypothetical protein [Limosilactobacillus caecicola]